MNDADLFDCSTSAVYDVDGIAQINLTLCMKISVLDEFDIRFSMYTIPACDQYMIM